MYLEKKTYHVVKNINKIYCRKDVIKFHRKVEISSTWLIYWTYLIGAYTPPINFMHERVLIKVKRLL